MNAPTDPISPLVRRTMSRRLTFANSGGDTVQLSTGSSGTDRLASQKTEVIYDVSGGIRLENRRAYYLGPLPDHRKLFSRP